MMLTWHYPVFDAPPCRCINWTRVDSGGLTVRHRYDVVEKANFASAALMLAKGNKTKVSSTPLSVPQTKLKEYYMTDSITRASSTMAKCVKAAANPISDKM